MLITVKKLICLGTLALMLFTSCRKEVNVLTTGSNGVSLQKNHSVIGNDPIPYQTMVYANWPESFELGTKTAYALGDVTFGSGIWSLNDALVGNSTSDRKNGTKSLRIQNTGSASMSFNLSNGATAVSVKHAVYGTDAASTWAMYYSTNGGSTWTQLGSTVTTTSTTLGTASFSINITGTIRFKIGKLSGGRLNIDDISVTDQASTAGGTVGGVATRDDNLGMGNPSSATAIATNLSNYLLVKPQYVLSYNNGRGCPNWVSWHLSSAWKGSAVRCDCFSTETLLPSTFFKAASTSYTGSGFDRGHMCPSDDRDGSSTDNAATFTMSNMVPQAPANNQGLWANLEAYCRTLISAGNELYIISGAYGSGGSGSNGGTTSSINSGTITVPSNVWKIVVVLPIGTGDASRVTSSTRIIAINTPNTQASNNNTWGYYRTSVDAIETATGYDFLTAVPTAIQTVIEASIDKGPTN
jgi:endonuclease G